MRRTIASFFAIAFTSACFASSGCSGGKIAVGSSEQELVTRSDGRATGDGATCSWEGTVVHAASSSDCGRVPTPSGYGPYAVGDEFTAPDRCNECKCTDRGIMCTLRECSGGGTSGSPGVAPGGGEVACQEDARICPDGSSVARVAPSCEFAPCPGEPVACQMDAKICPDGSSVGRVAPNCEFAPCPGEGATSPACVPHAAKGVGACEMGMGIRWTGSTCELVSGCSCEGADCTSGKLYQDIDACKAATADCPVSSPPSGGTCPVVCTDDAKRCADGTFVGRVAPSCAFAPCPNDPAVGCQLDAKICPDGSAVGRVAPSCEFAPCP